MGISARANPSEQTREDFCGDGVSKSRTTFDETGNVCKILLTLAGAALWILNRPDFFAKHIFDTRNGEHQSEQLVRLGAFHKWEVSRVCLELDAEFRIARCDAFQERFSAGEGVSDDRQIKIECYYGFRVSIDRYIAHRAKPHSAAAQGFYHSLEEIAPVEGNLFPEVECLHEPNPNVCLNIARLCVRIGPSEIASG